METLSSSDTERLLQAIQELSSLRDFSTYGVRALAIVHDLVESELPIFHTTRVQSRHISQTPLPGYPVLPPEMHEVARRHFVEHPIVAQMPRTLVSAYKVSDFATPAQFHRLEGFYQQFMRRIGCEDQMCLFLPNCPPQTWSDLARGNEVLVGIALNRSQRSFTERDRLMLNLLRPHLFQAYCNAQHYHQMQQNLTQLQQSIDCLGLIIISLSGQVQMMTSQAVQYLQTYFDPSFNALQLPDHLYAWLRHRIAAAASGLGANSPLRVEQAGKQLVVRLVIERHQDRCLLLLEEQTLSLLAALQLLGLSSRETEVLYWVLRGEDNETIARHLSVQLSTVRKHLESIFRKFGVRSRTEAIAHALDKLGIFAAPPPV